MSSNPGNPSASLSSTENSSDLEDNERRSVAPYAVQHENAMRARRWIGDGISTLLDPTTSQFAKGVASSIDLTRKYEPKIPVQKPVRGPRELTVRLWKTDTLHAATSLKRWYPQDRVAVLNMANPSVPGGSFLNGGTAQEETLCARTTLHRTLRKRFYPLKIPDVIISPDVLVCRGFDGSFWGYKLPNEEKFNVDVITAAAVQRPLTMIRAADGHNVYYSADDRVAMREGVLKILQAAVDVGARRLVLGAWGCGVFANPIHEVATMMRVAMLGTEGQLPDVDWAGHGLEEVVIAIHDKDTANGLPVLNGFLEVFQAARIPLPPGIQRVATTEICHVLRWPDRNAHQENNHSANIQNTAGPLKNGDDSLFGPSNDEDTTEASQDPTAANRLAQDIDDLLRQAMSRENKDSTTGAAQTVAANPEGRPDIGLMPAEEIVSAENAKIDDQVTEILSGGIPRLASPELPDYTSTVAPRYNDPIQTGDFDRYSEGIGLSNVGLAACVYIGNQIF